jgi:excinuclease ABC subunit A
VSPGELQRLRLANTQLACIFRWRDLCAGRAPRRACIQRTVRHLQSWALVKGWKALGNSPFVVEHDLAMMRRADWLEMLAPPLASWAAACVQRAKFDGLAHVKTSVTRYLFGEAKPVAPRR